MKIRKVGFFNELSKDSNDKTHLIDYVNKLKTKNKELLISYLNNGRCLVACGGMFPDYLNPKLSIKLNHDFLTDGQFAWFRDLSYYIDKYNVGIDEDFINTIEKNNYTMMENVKNIDGKNIELI